MISSFWEGGKALCMKLLLLSDPPCFLKTPLFPLERLEWQTMVLMRSQLFTSRAVGQLLDNTRPLRCLQDASQYLNFSMDLMHNVHTYTVRWCFSLFVFAHLWPRHHQGELLVNLVLLQQEHNAPLHLSAITERISKAGPHEGSWLSSAIHTSTNCHKTYPTMIQPPLLL